MLPRGLLPNGQFQAWEAPARYYENTVLELAARDDYGRIWPYTGGIVSAWWMTGQQYGLCDEDGKIICDPVFNEAEILEQDGKRLYLLTEYDRDEEGRQANRYTLAALDGSWVWRVEGVYSRETTTSEFHGGGDEGWENFHSFNWHDMETYEYITAQKDGLWGVLDYGGKLVLPFAYKEPVCFHEGLAAVLSGDEKTVTFIDSSGETVLGPYDAPPRQMDEWNYTGIPHPLTRKLLFRDGLCRFFEDGKCGVIDREGTVVIPAEYDFISGFGGGAAQFLRGGIEGVLNAQGEEIFVAEEPSSSYVRRDGRNNTILINHHNGETEVLGLDGTREPYEETAPGWTGISHEAGKGPVVTFADGRTLTFPESCSVSDLSDRSFIVYDREKKTWYVCNDRGEAISDENPGNPGWYPGAQEGYIYAAEESDGSEYPPPLALYSREGRRILPGVYSSVKVLDGRFLVRQGNAAGLMDEEGNYIIKVFLDNGKD